MIFVETDIKKLKTLKESLDEGLITKEEYEEKKQQLESNIKKVPKPEERKQQSTGSDKILIIAILIFLLLIGFFFATKYLFPRTPVTLTIEELNQMNIDGELEPGQGYIYKGAYSFIYADGLWYTQVKSPLGTKQLNIALHFGPRGLEDIKIRGSLNERFTNAEDVYVTFDPLGSSLNYIALAVGEFDRNLITGFGKKPIASCGKNETEACVDRPIVTCENRDKAVAYFKVAEETKVTFNGNCIIFEGAGLEITRAVDRVLLEWYGVMG